MSRRDVLRTVGIAGMAMAAGPAFLAACGGDDGGSGDNNPAGGGASADVGAQLASLLKIDPATAGKGMAFKLGNVLALTGSGSFFGRTMSRATDLAVEHIKA